MVGQFLLLIFSMLLLGCLNYSGYRNHGNDIVITPKNIKIGDVRINHWGNKGLLKKGSISKGVSFYISLPIIKRMFVKQLIEKKIDHWIVKVRRDKIASSQHLEYFTVPIAHNYKDDHFILTQTKSVKLHIVYAASIISTNLPNSNCPRLGHNKFINETKIKRGRFPVDTINVSVVNEKYLPIKSNSVGLRANFINGGKVLAGTYAFEFALYNSIDKKLMSNWYRVEDMLQIPLEKEVSTKGCPTFDHSSERIRRERPDRKFKFK